MVNEEVGSGGTVAGGYSVVRFVRRAVPSFSVGDAAYIAEKARRGILEMVVVKVIRPVKPRATPSANRVLYQDTFNGLWNEYDLVSLSTAEALIAAYQRKMATERNNLAAC